MAEPSTRAKWRALRSAWSSMLKKCLTAPALSERRFFDNHQLARETNSKSSSAIHRVLLPLTKRILEVSRQILYSPTFAQRRGSMRIILFMVAVIVGVRSSLAAEPPTPYEVIRFPSGGLP